MARLSQIWAWWLMPNHVHLIPVPSDADGLRRALAPVHRRYAGIIHARRKRTGHFWQGRFGCVAMDEEHLAAAPRYVTLNPVRARLADRARDWRWSSARAHLGGRDDGVTTVAPVCERYPDFANFLSEATDAEMIARLRSAGTIGRPLGSRKFLDAIERKTQRILKPAKREAAGVRCTVTVIRQPARLGYLSKTLIGIYRDRMKNLEEIWRIREEQVYPSLFGGTSRGIFTLTQALFRDRFGQADVDPRWLFLGAFEFAPTSERPFWIYVTSGHSNPWEDAPGASNPDGRSGTGVEFILATAERGDWAIREVLNLLAFDLLLRAGRYPGKSPLADGDRIPLRAPIDGDPACVLRNILISFAEKTWPGFSLPSGAVRFLTLVGISDAEVSFAKTAGSDALAAALCTKGYLVTDIRRQSL